MSMSNSRLSCTVCDYRGFMVFRSIALAYHFADGTTVESDREIRWCRDCRNIRDAESPQAAIAPMQTKLDALNAIFSSSGYRFKRWVSGMFGKKACPLRVQADNLFGRIRLAQARRDECLCLTCGCADTLRLEFDDDGICSGFQHDCGGHLRLEPVDVDAPRFSYGCEIIHLNEAGKRIDWDK